MRRIISILFLLLLPGWACADITSNLEAHWKFLASDGTDSSGNSRTLTLVGTPTFSSGPYAANPSIVFNGTSQGASRALDLTGVTDGVSVAFWAYYATTPTSDRAFCEFTPNYNSATGGFLAFARDGAAVVSSAVKGNIGTARNTYSQPSQAAWHHYVFVYDKNNAAATEAILYIDGVLGSATNTHTGNNTTASFANDTLYIGSRNSTSAWFAGEMADFRVYSRELSSGDVTELYSSFTSNPVIIIQQQRNRGQ